MSKWVVITALVLGTVAGCGKIGIDKFKGREKTTFDGIHFSGTVRASTGKEPRIFVSTIRGASKSLDGARQAAAYQGIRHCIKYYGTSDIDWEIGPQTPVDELDLDKGTLSYRGACNAR